MFFIFTAHLNSGQVYLKGLIAIVAIGYCIGQHRAKFRKKNMDRCLQVHKRSAIAKFFPVNRAFRLACWLSGYRKMQGTLKWMLSLRSDEFWGKLPSPSYIYIWLNFSSSYIYIWLSWTCMNHQDMHMLCTSKDLINLNIPTLIQNCDTTVLK